jgi:hypothetical protein
MLPAGRNSDLNANNSNYSKINPGTFSIYVQRMYAFLNISGSYVSVAARELLYEWTYQWWLVSCCTSGPCVFSAGAVYLRALSLPRLCCVERYDERWMMNC